MKQENKEIPKSAQIAIFAGGCFWCMEAAFQIQKGVYESVAGYTGGTTDNPTYKDIGDHVEAVKVYYDPTKISYEELLDIYFQSIDPTDYEGQFADKGSQYKTAIFYENDEQKKKAEEAIAKYQENFDKPIVVRLLSQSEFYPAEEYHQDYFMKNKASYDAYAVGSGRKSYLNEKWGDK